MEQNAPDRRSARKAALSRRDVLKGAAAVGLSMPSLLHGSAAAAASESAAPRAKRCILLFMNGGPSHLDTWDPKPEAPAEIRGEFRAISTNVPGIRISEHLPRLARIMDRLAVVRSVTSDEVNHERACRWMLTGRRAHPEHEYPGLLSVAMRDRGLDQRPSQYFAFPAPLRGGGRGFLSPECEALPCGDPTQVLHAPTDLAGAMQNAGFAELDLLPARVKEPYGLNPFGMSCLLARQLVEADSPLATVSLPGWDTHGNNFRTLERDLLPVLDAGLSSLVLDLEERGLLDETLVVWMGEFGRTPQINPNGGRDHWARCRSVVLAGGGVRGGQVVGSSDATGSLPAERPVTPEDLAATIYHLLGVNPETELTTPAGESLPLLESGSVVRELTG